MRQRLLWIGWFFLFFLPPPSLAYIFLEADDAWYVAIRNGEQFQYGPCGSKQGVVEELKALPPAKAIARCNELLPKDFEPKAVSIPYRNFADSLFSQLFIPKKYQRIPVEEAVAEMALEQEREFRSNLKEPGKSPLPYLLLASETILPALEEANHLKQSKEAGHALHRLLSSSLLPHFLSGDILWRIVYMPGGPAEYPTWCQSKFGWMTGSLSVLFDRNRSTDLAHWISTDARDFSVLPNMLGNAGTPLYGFFYHPSFDETGRFREEFVAVELSPESKQSPLHLGLGEMPFLNRTSARELSLWGKRILPLNQLNRNGRGFGFCSRRTPPDLDLDLEPVPHGLAVTEIANRWQIDRAKLFQLFAVDPFLELQAGGALLLETPVTRERLDEFEARFEQHYGPPMKAVAQTPPEPAKTEGTPQIKKEPVKLTPPVKPAIAMASAVAAPAPSARETLVAQRKELAAKLLASLSASIRADAAEEEYRKARGAPYERVSKVKLLAGDATYQNLERLTDAARAEMERLLVQLKALDRRIDQTP